jgi:DNA-binding beta-propeller fold protein YncE
MGSHNVSAYSINATTGALTSVGAAVASGFSPGSITVDSSGRFAYVANVGSGTVSIRAIDTMTGALTNAGADVSTGGSQPYSITTTGTIQ